MGARASVPAALRAAAEYEQRRRRLSRLEVPSDVAVGPTTTFLEWLEALEKAGMKVDGKPFTLSNRKALLPVYAKIPTTLEQAKGRLLVIQKASQLGLTIWEVLADLYLALKFSPVTIGMFLPDQATAQYKSAHRFMRLVRTVPSVYRYMTVRPDPQTGAERAVGEGNILTREIGESIFLFLWTSGRVSTESRPMDILSLDEVQGMSLEQIDKVRERLSGSTMKYMLMLSTANLPDLDINFWYLGGTQEVWHTECPSCGALSDLSDPAKNFPGCIEFNAGGRITGAPPGEYVWVCPACKQWLPDTQFGRYIAQNPGAEYESMLLPQTLSPTVSAREMHRDWNRAVTGDQRKTFYNRKLARPYIDASQLPVTMEHLAACVAEGRALGLVWEKSARDCYMGIDQMGSFNAVIIKRRLPDGRQAVVWCEAVFDHDPFERCAELMEQYGVQICVVEQLPNVNDARRFANRFPGRVFLASYTDLKDDFFVWGDDLSRSDRHTEEDERTRRSVTLHQYKCMQVALHRLAKRLCLFPDPALLEQEVIDRGDRKRILLVQDWVFVHFTKTALVVEDDDETRKPKGKVMKIGLDPHFSFANMLCDVGWARSYGTSVFWFPSKEDPMDDRQKAVAESLPGLPDGVVRMIKAEPNTCGACSAYNGGNCTQRRVLVQFRDPGCDWFSAADA